MSFDVDGDAYGRFMGRFSEPLADQFVELVNPLAGQRALDVGCGPGALTARIVDRLGVASVAAIDPSVQFVAATRARFPGIDVREGVAEELPYQDRRFDLTVAQLVVHFMSDPVAALAEMARVTRPGGTVAANVWDFGGDRSPLTPFWRAARTLNPDVTDESELAGTRDGDLVRIFREAGIRDATQIELSVHVEFASFEEWWEPFTLGVGPAGSYLSKLDERGQSELRRRCAKSLPAGSFALDAVAWTAVGRT
jgi:SAM-dependent methyltransferase